MADLAAAGVLKLSPRGRHLLRLRPKRDELPPKVLPHLHLAPMDSKTGVNFVSLELLGRKPHSLGVDALHREGIDGAAALRFNVHSPKLIPLRRLVFLNEAALVVLGLDRVQCLNLVKGCDLLEVELG